MVKYLKLKNSWSLQLSLKSFTAIKTVTIELDIDKGKKRQNKYSKMYITDESRWNLDKSSRYCSHTLSFKNFQTCFKIRKIKKKKYPFYPLLPVIEKKMLGATAATGSKRIVRTITCVTCGQIVCKMLPKTTKIIHQEKQKSYSRKSWFKCEKNIHMTWLWAIDGWQEKRLHLSRILGTSSFYGHEVMTLVCREGNGIITHYSTLWWILAR